MRNEVNVQHVLIGSKPEAKGLPSTVFGGKLMLFAQARGGRLISHDSKADGVHTLLEELETECSVALVADEGETSVLASLARTMLLRANLGSERNSGAVDGADCNRAIRSRRADRVLSAIDQTSDRSWADLRE